MARTVTIADFHALKAACFELERGTAEAAALALDGQQIVLAAEAQGRAGWAERFSAETAKSLERLSSKLINECIRAAEHFTGERRAPWEPFHVYWSRVSPAIADPTGQTLHKMMVRNGVTFISD